MAKRCPGGQGFPKEIYRAIVLATNARSSSDIGRTLFLLASPNRVKCPRKLLGQVGLFWPPALQARFHPCPFSVVSPISTKNPKILPTLTRLSLSMKAAHSSRTRSRIGLGSATPGFSLQSRDRRTGASKYMKQRATEKCSHS